MFSGPGEPLGAFSPARDHALPRHSCLQEGLKAVRGPWETGQGLGGSWEPAQLAVWTIEWQQDIQGICIPGGEKGRESEKSK